MVAKAELLPEAIRSAAMEWHIRISNELVDDNDRASFEQWRSADPRNADAYDRAASLWSAYGSINEQDLSPELFHGRFRYRLNRVLRAWLPEASPEASRSFALPIRLAGAVSVVAVLALVTSQLAQQPSPTIDRSAPPSKSHYLTAAKELRNVTLEDRSTLALGPGTEIQVTMSSEERRVKLERGAAVFNVAKDANRPFYVDAEGVSVRVLGTVFDVRNNGGVVRVTVAEGVVQAAHPFIINDSLRAMTVRRQLVAGQALTAMADRGLSTISEFGVDSFASWRDHRLKYEDAPLSELIADANRYSDRPIVLEVGPRGDAEGHIGDETVTFSFDGNNVDGMLSALPALFPVEIDRSVETAITIRSLQQHKP